MGIEQQTKQRRDIRHLVLRVVALAADHVHAQAARDQSILVEVDLGELRQQHDDIALAPVLLEDQPTDPFGDRVRLSLTFGEFLLFPLGGSALHHEDLGGPTLAAVLPEAQGPILARGRPEGA